MGKLEKEKDSLHKFILSAKKIFRRKPTKLQQEISIYLKELLKETERKIRQREDAKRGTITIEDLINNYKEGEHIKPGIEGKVSNKTGTQLTPTNKYVTGWAWLTDKTGKVQLCLYYKDTLKNPYNKLRVGDKIRCTSLYVGYTFTTFGEKSCMLHCYRWRVLK